MTGKGEKYNDNSTTVCKKHEINNAYYFVG